MVEVSENSFVMMTIYNDEDKDNDSDGIDSGNFEDCDDDDDDDGGDIISF